MLLSTRTRYGLQAMVELAASETVLSLAVLAQNQGISSAYLEQLFRTLKHAGFLCSVRGAGGGYILAQDAGEISALQIVQVLEGNSAVSECVSGGRSPCNRACVCAARPLFLELQAKINSVLRGTTLKDLANQYNEQTARLQNAE